MIHTAEGGANCIRIGLVNNMPGPALARAERQFRNLLDAAAGGMEVSLSLYMLPEVPRPPDCVRRIPNTYSDINSLWDTRLDGLIVTGTEPRAGLLRDEPSWAGLAALLDWADQNTYSSIWSCLAAHAAVYGMDGIERRRLGEKLFGLFECARVSENPSLLPLTAGVPERVRVPHSRWNDLPGDALMECGYQLLTKSEDAGADAFLKQRRSLFVFFQGHPEYETDTLLLEYRRDIRRFLRGELESYPSMPSGCLGEEAAALLTSLKTRALCDRREELLADFSLSLLADGLRNTWLPAGVSFYRNWLQYVCIRKESQKKIRVIRPSGQPSYAAGGGADAVPMQRTAARRRPC